MNWIIHLVWHPFPSFSEEITFCKESFYYTVIQYGWMTVNIWFDPVIGAREFQMHCRRGEIDIVHVDWNTPDHPHHTPLLNSSYSNLHNGANKFLTNKYINWNQISAWNENYYFYNYDFCRRFIKMKRNWTIMSEMDINGEECVSNFRYFFLQSLPVDRKILFLHNEDTLTLSNLL